MAKHEFPPEVVVVLRDPRRSQWDGVISRVCEGPRLERSVSPGEIAVFGPTGAVSDVDITEQLRGGPKTKTVSALEYRRVATRFVGSATVRA